MQKSGALTETRSTAVVERSRWALIAQVVAKHWKIPGPSQYSASVRAASEIANQKHAKGHEIVEAVRIGPVVQEGDGNRSLALVQTRWWPRWVDSQSALASQLDSVQPKPAYKLLHLPNALEKK